MYLEKSPNDKITIEKKVNVVPATVIMGPTLLALNIFWKSSTLINDLAVNFTSDKKTMKKNITIAA